MKHIFYLKRSPNEEYRIRVGVKYIYIRYKTTYGTSQFAAIEKTSNVGKQLNLLIREYRKTGQVPDKLYDLLDVVFYEPTENLIYE